MPWNRPVPHPCLMASACVMVATLSFGLGNWYLVSGDSTRARGQFTRSVKSGGWPAFGFIASEVELSRMK